MLSESQHIYEEMQQKTDREMIKMLCGNKPQGDREMLKRRALYFHSNFCGSYWQDLINNV